MTPQEHAAKLRQMAEEARAAAGRHNVAATEARHEAEQYTNTALACEHDATRKVVEAINWDAIAAALESGAITFQDGRLLTEVRSAFAEAHDGLAAATRALPVFGATQREARGFEIDDLVNVADANHDLWGACGTVTGLYTGTTEVAVKFSTAIVRIFSSSQLMHHDAFIAQMDAAGTPHNGYFPMPRALVQMNDAEELEREGDVIAAADRANASEAFGWADPAVRAAVRATIAATPAPVGAWDDADGNNHADGAL